MLDSFSAWQLGIETSQRWLEREEEGSPRCGSKKRDDGQKARSLRRMYGLPEGAVRGAHGRPGGYLPGKGSTFGLSGRFPSRGWEVRLKRLLVLSVTIRLDKRPLRVLRLRGAIRP